MTNPNDPHTPPDGSQKPEPNIHQTPINTGNPVTPPDGPQKPEPNIHQTPTNTGNPVTPPDGPQKPEPNIHQTTANTGNPMPNPQQAPKTPVRKRLIQALRKAAGYSDQLTPEQQITRRSFVSFSAFLLLGAAAWKSWFWLKDAAESDGVQTPLRKGLNINDKIAAPTLSPNHLAKTYPLNAANPNVRYNSGVGLAGNPDPAAWRLQVTTLDNRQLAIPLEELKALPKTEFAFEFKCIEGWSQISWWGGVRFSDFMQHYNLQKEASLPYVGLSTPDDQYYVGIDMPSALHPQTLLCYEMNGKPLAPRHGAPLRLIIPIKYGVKNLKKIGKMHFSTTRPRDYWFERGYDYYCGL
jgi:DMSO/TMAO reductase YedYZ molybdopterin-dependent catalytic subunit